MGSGGGGRHEVGMSRTRMMIVHIVLIVIVDHLHFQADLAGSQ